MTATPPVPWPTRSPGQPLPRVRAARFANSSALGGFTSLRGQGFETRLPPHVHSSYVLGVVDEGVLRVTANGVSQVATPGSIIALAPFVVHTEVPLTPGGWSFRYLFLTEAVVRGVLGAPVGGDAALPFRAPVIVDGSLASALGRLDDDLRVDGDSGKIEADMVALLRRVRSHCLAAGKPHLPRERRNIRTVRSLLTERPIRGVTIADLAGAAGLSPWHFSRVFSAEVGLPPYAYYEQVRIAFAHDMIRAGLDLTDVAFRLGYVDQSHLTRQFHRGSFTTPGRLAQLARGLRLR